ncbi:MAG: glucokinase [Watsoniomyces obsoletus]|nr:MAG: glucokinase [Watsoniomyces obsoletus]
MTLVEKAKGIAAQFEYTPDDVRKGVEEFLREMEEGLQQDGTTLSQIPTYVTSVPNGTEKGVFLAVDLGGTNFRVCSVQLHGNTTFTLMQSKVAIPRELMVAKTSKELFSFLARQIEIFLKTHHSERFEAHIRRRKTLSAKEGYRDENIFRLGFTFSFPVQQVGINKGALIRWTKGFDIAEAVGQDICGLLQTEIDRLGLPVRVAALVNDTVGTLMARSYTSPGKTGALLGGIFGTGTNGAYVEKLENITKMAKTAGDSDYDRSTGEMVVNTEWGSFDNPLKVLPTTKYDAELDKESVNPGIQMFEKRVSGMFLGEILRRALLDLVNDPEAQLFKDENSSSNDIRSTTNIAPDSALYKQWGIDTSFLSIVQEDHSEGLKVVRQTVDQYLGVTAASYEDAQAVKEIVTAVGKRSARLSAVAIGSVVIKSGRLGNLNVPTTTSESANDPSTDKNKPPSSNDLLDSVKQGDITGAATGLAAKMQASAAPLIDQAPSMNLSTLNNPTITGASSHSGTNDDDDDAIDIGVDGSLVEYYPGFISYIRGALREISQIGSKGEPKIRIGIAKDGSGVGAALIALVAGREGPPPPEGRYSYLTKVRSASGNSNLAPTAEEKEEKDGEGDVKMEDAPSTLKMEGDGDVTGDGSHVKPQMV